MFERDTHVLDTLKVSSYVASMDHDVFIDENIEDEAYYRSVISTLNKASDKDTIRFIISSNGGFGSTAMVLAHAMDSCPAHKIGVLSGNCKSAATIIALHCDSWEVGSGCDWMAHTASFGLGGSAHVVQKYHDHEQKQIRKLLFREYLGFYTEEEIEQIAKGDDSLLDDEEVTERLQRFAEHRVSRQQSAMEDMFSQQNEQSDKYENLLLKTLVQQGKISQEEADIAQRVRDATVILDEEEGESLFETLSCEDEDCCEEGKVLCQFSPNSSCKSFEIYGYTIEYVLEGDSVKNIRILGENTRLSVDDGICLSDAKVLAKEWGIKYPHNIKDENLIKKVVKYFEDLVLDHVTQ